MKKERRNWKEQTRRRGTKKKKEERRKEATNKQTHRHSTLCACVCMCEMIARTLIRLAKFADSACERKGLEEERKRKRTERRPGQAQRATWHARIKKKQQQQQQKKKKKKEEE